MTKDDVDALISVGLALFGGLGLLIWHELRPQSKVIGRVTRVWRERVSSPWLRVRYFACFVEIDRDGLRVTYSCDPGYYGELKAGQTVRLHLKGKFVEYIRVLNQANEKA